MALPFRRVIGIVLPNPTYYGWCVVGACMLCAALSAPGQSFALALYMEPVAAELGASRVEVATLYAWATLAAAVALPAVGRIADRTSSRSYLSGVVALMAISLLVFSTVTSWPALAVSFFLLRLLGQGATGLGILTTVLRWFERHRGRAVAIAMMGYAVGEFVMPTVIVNLHEAVDWRASLVVLASAYLLLLAPMVFVVARAPPSSPYEVPPVPTASLPIDSTAAEAIRMPRFWVLAVLVSVTPLVLTGLLLNHVALFDRVGWPAKDVARALQAYAIAGLVSTYAVGTLLDRAPARLGVVVSMVFLALALLVPLGVRSPVGVVLYGALLGAAAGATSATNGVIWPAYFGVGSIGAIKGIVSTVRNGLTAAGAPIGAWLIERSDGFSGILAPAAALAAIAGCLALVVPRPRPSR